MKIEQLDLTGNDERGYTAEYEHDRSGRQLILFRKAGTVSGRHYHKGISSTKDPEIFIVLHGTCVVNWRNIDDENIESSRLTGPAKLAIRPYTWHEVIAETDCVFLEMNSIEEHAADTFYLDQ